MKSLKRISLHNLSQAELSKREENLLKGGFCSCTCSCYYACGCLYEGEKENEYDSYYGGSSTADNGASNAIQTGTSTDAGMVVS